MKNGRQIYSDFLIVSRIFSRPNRIVCFVTMYDEKSGPDQICNVNDDSKQSNIENNENKKSNDQWLTDIEKEAETDTWIRVQVVEDVLPPFTERLAAIVEWKLNELIDLNSEYPELKDFVSQVRSKFNVDKLEGMDYRDICDFWRLYTDLNWRSDLRHLGDRAKQLQAVEVFVQEKRRKANPTAVPFWLAFHRRRQALLKAPVFVLPSGERTRRPPSPVSVVVSETGEKMVKTLEFVPTEEQKADPAFQERVHQKLYKPINTLYGASGVTMPLLAGAVLSMRVPESEVTKLLKVFCFHFLCIGKKDAHFCVLKGGKMQI